MKYNPEKHHRQTIRLQGYDYTSSGAYFITICTHQRQCLFGEIVDAEMQLNVLGQMIHACWQRLPYYFPTLTLDAFVVMPNHVHGILVLGNSSNTTLGQNAENLIVDSPPHAMSDQPHNSEPELGVAFGQKTVGNCQEPLPNAAPLPPRLVSGSVGAMILNFKSVTTRSINRIRRSSGTPIWQRNYYEHIIRNEASWQFIRQYIHNNPLSWQVDQLHPDNPSKW